MVRFEQLVRDRAESGTLSRHHFGSRASVVRFTGSNLLNASKDETFYKWETVGDQLSGDINALDEFELESEKAGPVFQLVARVQF